MRNFDGPTLNPGRKVAMAQLDEKRFSYLSPVCSYCKHWRTELLRGCSAFPTLNGIPEEIWQGKNRHMEPYPGDHGVHFERRAK